MIIALYERTVAVYAELIHINAFHQPGVQAYKLAAKSILELRAKVIAAVSGSNGISGTAAEIAAAIGMPDDEVEIAGLFDKSSANCDYVSRAWDPDRKTWIYTVK